MTGRKPKPAHLKLIEGNPGKRRVVPAPSLPRGAVPDPPAHMDAEAIAEWNRVTPGLDALHLMQPNYRAPLAAYCMAYSRWVRAETAIAKMGAGDMLTGGLMIKTTNGNAIQNPLVGTANKAALDMVRYAAEFAMTPCAQARLSVDGAAGTTSKWAGLTGGVQTG